MYLWQLSLILTLAIAHERVRSYVGQIHIEEDDAPRFWGMSTPILRLSPVTKPPRAAFPDEPVTFDQPAVAPVRTKTYVGQIHDEEFDLLKSTPRHAQVLSPFRERTEPLMNEPQVQGGTK